MHQANVKYLVASELDLLWGLTVSSAGYQHIEPGTSYPPANHPSGYLFSTSDGRILEEYQLLYISHGQGTFKSSSAGEIPVREGSMFLLFPGEWHTYMPDPQTGWDEYWIGFKGINIDNRVTAGFFSRQKPMFHPGIHEGIVSLYKQALGFALEQRAGFQQLLAGIVNHLLGLTYALDKNSPYESSGAGRHIGRAKVIIQENLSSIKPEQIARKLNMSYSLFRKTFKEYTGFAPSQYILELKIGSSKEMLSATDRSIKEIAFQLGFDNQDYFSTAFRKKTGMTPIQYRKFTRGR